MGLGTATVIHSQVPGAAKEVFGTLLCDTSYPTGGYAFAVANIPGLSAAIDWLAPIGATGGYVPVLDWANKKIMLFKGAGSAVLVEETNATNVATIVITFLAKGR